MNQKGIGLIIIIISIAIILLLAGSGYYFSISGQKSVLEKGNDAIQKAKDVKEVSEVRDKWIEQELEKIR